MRVLHNLADKIIVYRWFAIKNTKSDTVLKKASLEYGRDFRWLI